MPARRTGAPGILPQSARASAAPRRDRRRDHLAGTPDRPPNSFPSPPCAGSAAEDPATSMPRLLRKHDKVRRHSRSDAASPRRGARGAWGALQGPPMSLNGALQGPPMSLDPDEVLVVRGAG